MSKQSDARAAVGYVEKTVPKVCANCVFFSSTILEREEYGAKWVQEKNLRCVRGGFAVKKMASCVEHTPQ